ncbi:hypothetical protein HELRODRAFT_191702 [Helobdella robusta]|uniref:Cadherin domain-containing protein n=1 Tax=Helobdella robusta TaxID=6412 RepID=T1FT80_HELRO|nr:hypothetical protein HELRODRAFT_191702 [Helobdella robusta]ESO04707.1 hypothetical protein HELRODRAFT_191702 [Helobdella robusta]
MPSFPVVFSVVIEGRTPIYTQVTVNVRPVNHNPKFDSNPYRFSVRDNADVGALLYSDMNVIDEDTGPNGTVAVLCDVTSSPQASNICSYFTLSQSNISGFPDRSRISIILAKRLDFNLNYSFYLIARDQGNPSLTDSTNVIMTVENSQDSRPIFIGTPYFVNVPELGNDLSTSLMSFQVRDARPPGPGNSLQLTLEGDTKNWFTLGYPSLNGDTYTVQLRRNSPNINLDENSQRSRYAINIKATQIVNNQLSSVYSMTTINVNIIDINNNAPIFSQSSYTANVSEGLVYLATVAGVSIVVTDLDLQDNAYFELSLNHLPPLQPGIFQVSPTFGQGSVAAALQVAKPEFIRYDVMKTMNLTIVARETRTAERRSSMASITIYITSPNNHAPYFPNILNPISIFDDTPVYSQISSYIRAQDDDPGDNGKITYKIISTDNSDKYFSIDPNSGILTLSSPLSYSVQSTFLFQVQATDGGGLTATTSILINIKDHNFNYPVFDSDSYITYVPEGTTDMQPRVTVRAALRPMISDRVYYYQFGPGISQLINTTFRVNPNTGSITMLQPVDFNRTPNKQGYFDIPVACGVVNYPEIPIGHTNVRVYIMDSNNHPPVFTNPNYQSITIPETTKPDTNVMRVTATDEDTGDFGKIVYYIETGSRDDFVVDPFTGDIKVARQPNLKPEQNYNITVIARDSGQPPLSATTFVAIIITDSISHNPVFSPDQYTYVIIESTPANTLVGTLNAKSQDKRAKLSYSFIYNTWKVYKNDQEVSASVADWFSIDQDIGTIKIRNPLIQYSQSDKVTVNVTVRVTNPDNVNDVLSAIAPVTILILPIAQSSDKVVFSPAADDFNFQMIEKQPVNTPLYNFVAFYLKDSSQIRNFILTENPGTPRGYFMIDGSTGALRVSKVINYLDLPSSKNLTYKVKATAQPPSTAYALANVTINILPLNGEKPIFVNGNYIFRVNSTQPTGTTIGVISATCPYGTSPTPVVTYQLITPSDYFYIDQNNGTFVLSKRLDSADSTQLLYNLIAQAYCVDLKTTSTALIQVYVTPIKTLVPVFTNTFYRFPASAGYTGLLGQVLAYDPNPFNKSSIVYTILSVTPGPSLHDKLDHWSN